jgi:hypothetical protein
MTESVKFKGYLKIESLDANRNIVDVWEDPNLIMDTARVDMAGLLANFSGANPVNTFVLGNNGHTPGLGEVSENILVPKTSLEGFVSTRTMLFAEDDTLAPGINYNYSISWTPPVDANSTVLDTALGVCSISTSITATTTQYIFEIPTTEANNAGIATFTEAAMYTGSNIFSMRTFPAKIKDDTVILRITWSITF